MGTKTASLSVGLGGTSYLAGHTLQWLVMSWTTTSSMPHPLLSAKHVMAHGRSSA